MLEVWFNRDEQRTRPIATAPEIRQGPVPYIAPQDPQGGGTWIFVNQTGRIGALLNFYEARSSRPTSAPLRSRGLLVRDLAGTSAGENIQTFLSDNIQQHPYAPFYFWSAGREEPESLWAWDGHRLEQRALSLPMHTTSSFQTGPVCAHRQERFLNTVLDPTRPTSTELATFHQDGQENGTAWSVHMSREDASTVSTSCIRIQDRQADFDYAVPGQAGLHVRRLELRA